MVNETQPPVTEEQNESPIGTFIAISCAVGLGFLAYDLHSPEQFTNIQILSQKLMNSDTFLGDTMVEAKNWVIAGQTLTTVILSSIATHLTYSHRQ